MDQTSLIKTPKPSDFRKSDYKKYDWLGKTMLTWYLMKSGHTVNVPKENFGLDMTSQKDGKLWHWEAEVRKKVAWTTMENFPFPTVSFLHRKEKHANSMPTGDNFWYAELSFITQALVFAPSKIIFQEKYFECFEADRDGVVGEDKRYAVPRELCHWKYWKDMV